MMVNSNSSVDNAEVLPMQRFIQDLMRSSTKSISTKKETLQSNSAKSVMDFDNCISKNSKNKNNNNNIDQSNSSDTEEVRDTFDMQSLVLVSDNARVFANARPKARSAPLTSASWHSSSELRKQYTAKSRWGGTPDTSPLSSKNQSFALPQTSSRTGNRGRTIDKRYVTRRTSDSCLSVPTRSWMKPQHQQQQQTTDTSLPQKPQRRVPSESNLSIPRRSWMNEQPPPQQPLRTRRTGMPVQPSRSAEGPPKQPMQGSGVASPFATSPLEAALGRFGRSRPIVKKQSSSDSLVSSEDFSGEFSSADSVRSFESFGSNDDWGETGVSKSSTLRARDSRQLLRARDSRQLISCNKTTATINDSTANTNASWSPLTTHQEPNRLLNKSANDRPQQLPVRQQQQQQHPRGGLAPIPPSLLLPYDRFQADAPISSSESLASASSRNPRLGHSRSSRSFRGSRNSLHEGNTSSSRNHNLHKGSSKNSLFPTTTLPSAIPSGRNHNNNKLGSINSLGSKSYHNHYSGSSSSFRSAQANEGLRSQSDHYSPISTLELALGDMAPRRIRRHGVRRKKSNDTM